MNTSRGRVARWVLIICWIFASLQRSEAISWKRQPEKPYFLVEEKNNTGVSLVWEFDLEIGEVLRGVTFRRQRDAADSPEDIAGKIDNNPFTVFPQFISNYTASLPSELKLRNAVTNDEEFIYSIEVNYVRNNQATPRFKDSVKVIVYVPPRFTTEPERESEASIGESLNLICNASGDPLPNVTWSKDGNQLMSLNVTGSVLRLFNVKREDIGSYRCKAKNIVGEATRLAIVNVACPENQCVELEFGIEIIELTWKQAFNNSNAIEYKTLKSNVASEIARLYTLPHNAEKKLYGITIVEFRPGSIIAVVRLRFERNVSDPLKPLEDDIKDSSFGSTVTYKVATQLINTTIPATPTTEEPSPTSDKVIPSDSLSAAEIGGIVGGSVGFVVVLIIISLAIFFRCQPRSQGKSLSEADGYRMNKQPPSSGLGTASPAFVEARMFAPPNADNRKGDQEKRPLPAGGSGGQDGQGGFELWC